MTSQARQQSKDPTEGQDHVELRARTVSGDIDLETSKEIA